MKTSSVWKILKTAIVKSDRDDISRLGAALAFYSLFSLAPVLYVALTVSTVAFKEDMARQEIQQQISRVVGPDGADAIATVMSNSPMSLSNEPVAILNALLFLFGLTAAFNALLATLNQIWEIEATNPSFLWVYVRRRLIALGLVVLVGALALASLVLATFLSGIERYFPELLAKLPLFPQLINIFVSLCLLTVFTGTIYRVVPDAPLRWGDVFVGAAVTASLITLGNFLIGMYIGKAGIGSAFGAAGSVVLVLFWVYYSAQVFLFGAEVTHVNGMHRNGSLAKDKTT
jgi:membrane protein